MDHKINLMYTHFANCCVLFCVAHVIHTHIDTHKREKRIILSMVISWHRRHDHVSGTRPENESELFSFQRSSRLSFWLRWFWSIITFGTNATLLAPVSVVYSTPNDLYRLIVGTNGNYLYRRPSTLGIVSLYMHGLFPLKS